MDWSSFFTGCGVGAIGILALIYGLYRIFLYDGLPIFSPWK